MKPEIISRWDYVPEAMSTFEGLHWYADRVATHSFDTHGNCSSLWTIVREHDAHIVHTPWADEAEKQFHIDWLRETFAMDQSIERFAFIGEAFLFDHLGDDNSFRRQLDAIMVQTQQRDGRAFLRSYEVLELPRQQRGRVLFDEQEYEDLQGQMATLFEPAQTLGFRN